MRRDERGQAIAEYTLVMIGLLIAMWGTAQGFNAFHTGSFLELLRGFGIYSKSFDLILSLPFP